MSKLLKIVDNFESSLELSKSCNKPFSTKRRKFFGIHLYRTPLALKSDWFGLNKQNGLSWEQWEKRVKKVCPLQFWIRNDFITWWHVLFMRFGDLKYNIKCYFFPYNVIKINTLPRTWSDEDKLLVHGMFAVLERFFSQNPEKIVDYKEKPYSEFWEEINEVWDWWQKREERQKKIDEENEKAYKVRMLGKRKFKSAYSKLEKLEMKFDKQEAEMLNKIIKWRKYLWV